MDAPLVRHAGRDAGVDLLAKIEEPVGDWQPGPAVRGQRTRHPQGDARPRRGSSSTRRRGKRAVVSVTCGVPGVVAAHTPDVCFLGSGYKLKSPPSQADAAAGRRRQRDLLRRRLREDDGHRDRGRPLPVGLDGGRHLARPGLSAAVLRQVAGAACRCCTSCTWCTRSGTRT